MFTWCDEQQHEQQDGCPKFSGFPHGLQLSGGRLIHLLVDDGSLDGFRSFPRVFAVTLYHA